MQTTPMGNGGMMPGAMPDRKLITLMIISGALALPSAFISIFSSIREIFNKYGLYCCIAVAIISATIFITALILVNRSSKNNKTGDNDVRSNGYAPVAPEDKNVTVTVEASSGYKITVSCSAKTKDEIEEVIQGSLSRLQQISTQ
jgi:hypothetical protein